MLTWMQGSKHAVQALRWADDSRSKVSLRRIQALAQERPRFRREKEGIEGYKSSDGRI